MALVNAKDWMWPSSDLFAEVEQGSRSQVAVIITGARQLDRQAGGGDAATRECKGGTGGMRVCLLYLGLELEIDGVGRGAGVCQCQVPQADGASSRDP